MVRVTINSVEYKVKSSWDEVDPDKLMVCETFKEELECLSDLPKEIIEKATDVQLWPMYTIISFIDDLEVIPVLEAVEIQDESYENMELLRKRVQQGKPWRKCLKAARVYYPDEKDSVRLIALGDHIINQLNIFLSKYEELNDNEDELSNNQILAGIETLNAFESWGVAFTLAGKDVLKLRSVFEMKAITIYEALRYNHREAKYRKKLFDLENPRKT